MLLPYASDHLPTRRPLMTWTLLLVTAAITVLVVVGDRVGWWRAEAIFGTFGIVPNRFRPFSLFTLLTYFFFHENFGHLLLNMLYLWVFGAGVEEAVGRWRYLLLYVAGGVVGGALQWAVTVALMTVGSPGTGVMPIVGASAACSGLVGLFAVRYYRARLAFVGLPFRPHVVAVVALFLGLEIGGGLWNLATGSMAGGVAHWAHVGGFIFGLAMAQALHLGEQGRRAYLTTEATQAMDRNVPGAAVSRWENLLARDSNNVTARIELARAWLLLGDTEQAGSQYLLAVSNLLARNQRAEAARLYSEMCSQNLKAPSPSPAQQFALGAALEDQEQFDLAAETLRALAVHAPEAPEAETALLKVVSLYIHRLNRREEARILLSLFLERYPHSQWLSLAEDLRRATEDKPGSDSDRSE